MCLAIPAQIKALCANNKAIVDVGGITKEISLSLLSEPVDINDFVIIHVGFALNKLNKAQAEKTLNDFKEMLKEDDK